MSDKTHLQMQKERILWVDYAKLIGIYLVILGHLNLRSDSVNAFINSFHMQLFFLLAGVCFKKEGVVTVLRKNARGLLIPYTSFQLLCYPYWLCKSYFQNHIPLTINNYFAKPVLGFFYGVVHDTQYSYMVIGACWFLLALFFIKVFASLVLKLPGYLQLLSCIISVVSGILLKTQGIMLPFSLNVSLLCLPLFLSGFYLKDWMDTALKRLSLKSKLLVIAILACGLYTLANMNGMFHVCDGVWGKTIYLYYINAVMGGGIIILLASLVKTANTFFLFLSRNTMIIMVFEIYAYAPFKLIIQRLLNVSEGQQDYMPFLLGLIVAAASLLVSSIPCFVINHYFPFLIGKKKSTE